MSLEIRLKIHIFVYCLTKIQTMSKKKFNMENIFFVSDRVLSEIENPDWSDKGWVHNWKTYIDDDLKQNWHQLTANERRIIAHYAETRASNEDWD